MDDIFIKAQKLSPAILFIDGINHLGHRGRRDHPAAMELISHLMHKIKKMEEKAKIVIIASAEHPGYVDPQFFGPDKIETVTYIPRPDHKALAAIIRYYLRPHFEKNNVADDLNYELLGALALGNGH